jgi:pyridoxal phosphate enzyme (YggS family)
MTGPEERLAAVRGRIDAACRSAGRDPAGVTLIAVSKTKPWPDVAAFAELGVRDFGENYVQEALAKQEAARAAGHASLRWHLIGTLQSNKAKFLPGNFCLFHDLDSVSLGEKLNRAAAAAGLVQDCLLEVNVDLETTKGGVGETLVPQVLAQLAPLANLRLTGLMCIPAPVPGRDPRAPFARLRELRDRLNAANAYREPLRELSMGMSADFEAAVLEGATLVRVGTTLFGARAPQ